MLSCSASSWRYCGDSQRAAVIRIGRHAVLLETYDFGLHQPAKNYLRFPANITIVAPCVGGVYIVADKTYWYAGADIALAECIEKLPYGAVKGTRFDLVDDKAVGWFEANGFVIASMAQEKSRRRKKRRFLFLSRQLVPCCCVSQTD